MRGVRQTIFLIIAGVWEAQQDPCIRRSGTVPPAYPTRGCRILLTAFHGSYPTSCPFRIRQDKYDFHHILQLSRIILERDSSLLGLLIRGRLCLPIFDSLILLLRRLFSFPLALWTIIFSNLGFTLAHCSLTYFLYCDALFWLGVTSVYSVCSGARPREKAWMLL